MVPEIINKENIEPIKRKADMYVDTVQTEQIILSNLMKLAEEIKSRYPTTLEVRFTLKSNRKMK